MFAKGGKPGAGATPCHKAHGIATGPFSFFSRKELEKGDQTS